MAVGAYQQCSLPDKTNHVFPERDVEKLIKGKLWRYARKRRLLCKNGMYVAVNKDGVYATKDSQDPCVDLQVVSIGSDMIALWGIKSALYIGVHGDTGKICTTSKEGRHCVFIETLTTDYYSIYETYQSVSEGKSRCLVINMNNNLIMTEEGVIPGREGQFMWEILDDNVEK